MHSGVTQEQFVDLVRQANITTEYVIIKPNWVSCKPGEFTEATVLEWLCNALPGKKLVVVESYTP